MPMSLNFLASELIAMKLPSIAVGELMPPLGVCLLIIIEFERGVFALLIIESRLLEFACYNWAEVKPPLVCLFTICGASPGFSVLNDTSALKKV